ncbi:MAG: alpha/beta fold hydrolase [Patescibacteria group bacterium]
MQSEDYRHSFEYGPTDAPESALLVHGLTGSTYDVSGLGEHLASLGYRVRGVLLPGHGTKPSDLNKVGRSDWLNAVEDQWSGMAGVKHFVGLSLGGIIGAYLTATKKIAPNTLTIISAPVYYPKSWMHRWVIPWLYAVKKYSKKYWIKPEQFEWYSQRGKYVVIPLRGSLEAYHLAEETRPVLGRISAPTLIVHSRHDPVVAARSVDAMSKKIVHSQICWSDEPEHRLLGSERSQALYQRIAEFVKSNGDRTGVHSVLERR